MNSESATASFSTAFMQIHLVSALIAAIVLKIAGILAGIATYLLAIHFFPALTYLMGIKEGRVFKAMFYSLK